MVMGLKDLIIVASLQLNLNIIHSDKNYQKLLYGERLEQKRSDDAFQCLLALVRNIVV